MMDITELARTAGWLGGGIGAVVWSLDRVIRAASTVEAAPAKLKRWGTARAEDIVVANQRAENTKMLADKADIIIAALTPNGGASLSDAVHRIESNVTRMETKLDDHITACETMEERLYTDMAEIGSEVDGLRRSIRALYDRRQQSQEGEQV